VFNETLTTFMNELGPHALAGLGFAVIVIPLIFVSLTLIYVVMIVFMVFGMAGSAALLESGSDAGAGILSLGTFLGMFVAMFALLALVNACTAPFLGSLYRAVARHQRRERELSFGAAFSSLGTNLWATLFAQLLVMGLVLTGLLLCYFPALIVGFLLSWTFPLVAIHGRGALSAIGTSVAHCRKNLNWHVLFYLALMAVHMVANNIPILGTMFGVAFHVRMYREVFGDGPEPVTA
jgi:hypothetical protein